MRTAGTAFVAIVLLLAAFLLYAGYFDCQPFEEVPAAARPKPGRDHLAAVIFSGDLGYRVAMGRKIGSRLAADGIPVIGVNSLTYFRGHRSVREVTQLIAKAIGKALAFGNADQVVLIGQSFGADALQAGLEGLPADLRTKIRTAVLSVPTRQLYLRVSPGEMLDLGRPDAEVLPTLRRITWVPLTCIYGIKEEQSPCRVLAAPNMRKVALPGGHAMHRDADRIYAAVLAAIDAATDKAGETNGTKISVSDVSTAVLPNSR